jgi:hypothetical protein
LIDLAPMPRWHDHRVPLFELERTLDGGHLELQALRYAAMISTMTFDDLVGHYENYLTAVEPEAADEAQQVIPLPEASELTIQLRRKATQERAVRGTDGRDWTQYVITGSAGESEPLRKRQAILTMVTTLRAAGVPAREIAKAIPPSRFFSVDGTLAGEDLREAFARTYPKGDPGRWFMESPIHDEGRTWIVTKMWGRNTEPVLERLIKLAPEQSGIGYEAVPL